MNPVAVGFGKVRQQDLDHNNHMNLVVYMAIVNRSFESLVTSLKAGNILNPYSLYFVREANLFFLGELLLDDEWSIDLTAVDLGSPDMHVEFTLRVKSKVKFRTRIQLVSVDSRTRKLAHSESVTEIDLPIIEVFEFKH
jgi:acyl-CoA thioesterase FadM